MQESICHALLKPRTFLNFCPYTHLWRAIKKSIAERRLPDSAQPGAFIVLLGIFCPIFWLRFFSGASAGELKFHAIHSAVVAIIGIVMVITGLMKDKGNTL